MGWLRIDVQIENAAGFSQLKTHCEFLIKCFVSKRGWVGQCSSGSESAKRGAVHFCSGDRLDVCLSMQLFESVYASLRV